MHSYVIIKPNRSPTNATVLQIAEKIQETQSTKDCAIELIKMSKYLANFILSLLWSRIECFNILAVFPHHGFSHFKVFQPFVYALAERGHHVTVITHISSNKIHPNYEEMILSGKPTVNIAAINEFVPQRSLQIILEEYFALSKEGFESCTMLYESGFHSQILENHNRHPYDLMITEFFNTDCQFGIAFSLDVQVIGISSCALMPWYYDRISLPDYPSYVQSEFIGFNENLNFQNRIVNFIQMKLLKILYRFHTNYNDNQLIKKYLNMDVDVYQVAKRHTSLVFVNQHFSLSGTRPSTTQYVEIGGIHLSRDTNVTLSPELNNFLSKSKNGVILISWGSVLRFSSIPNDKLIAMISILKRLPFDVIWKWESDIKPIEDKKFLFLKWVPQAALLAHPKIKIFWSHGGLLGTTESIHFAKPLIITPFYGDQFLNAHAVANRRVGIILHYENISLKNVLAAFKEVTLKKYSDNAVKVSALFNDRPIQSLETAVWWTDYILRHQNDSEFLKSNGMNLNWIVYHSLDSIFVIFLLCLLPIAAPLMWLKVCKK